MRASDRVLENLSRTLRLSTEERDYLFFLAQSRPAPIRATVEEHVPDTVKRALDALNVPAQVINPRWDLLYWNEMIVRCFSDYGQLPPEKRNLIRILLTSPEYLEDPAEYETRVRRIAAKLRIDYSQAGDDPAFDSLIEEMCAISPTFREMWRSPEVRGRAEGINHLRHPVLGGINLEHTSFVVEGSPSLRVIIFVPLDADSARKVAEQARLVEAGRAAKYLGEQGERASKQPLMSKA